MSRNHYLVLLLLAGLLSGCNHLKMGMFMLNDNPGENDPNSIVRGEEAYRKNCTRCHGENGDGRGVDASLLTVPPTNFRSPEYTKAPIRIAAHISYGKGAEMPQFVEKLPYETIWDIANYLHSLPKQ